MTLEEYRDAVIAALQQEPYGMTAEEAATACDNQPKSMKIFHANETVEVGAQLIAEGAGWQPV